MVTIYENEAPVERVILVAISERDGDDTVASLEELAELAATAGAEVVGTVIQNLEHMNPGTYGHGSYVADPGYFCGKSENQ